MADRLTKSAQSGAADRRPLRPIEAFRSPTPEVVRTGDRSKGRTFAKRPRFRRAEVADIGRRGHALARRLRQGENPALALVHHEHADSVFA
jgi:hypothetical protein